MWKNIFRTIGYILWYVCVHVEYINCDKNENGGWGSVPVLRIWKKELEFNAMKGDYETTSVQNKIIEITCQLTAQTTIFD